MLTENSLSGPYGDSALGALVLVQAVSDRRHTHAEAGAGREACGVQLGETSHQTEHDYFESDGVFFIFE